MAARRLEVAPSFLEKVLDECGILASAEAAAGNNLRVLVRRCAATALRRRASVLAMEPELGGELLEIADQLDGVASKAVAAE